MSDEELTEPKLREVWEQRRQQEEDARFDAWKGRRAAERRQLHDAELVRRDEQQRAEQERLYEQRRRDEELLLFASELLRIRLDGSWRFEGHPDFELFAWDRWRLGLARTRELLALAESRRQESAAEQAGRAGAP
jgi:hypothetical protein